LVEGYGMKNMGPRLSSLKAYTIPLQMQSHSLGMTPVSIKQLRATLQQKSIRTQKQSETNWSAVSNTMVHTKSSHHKHEDFNLVFTNHGKGDRIYPLRTKIPSKKR
jgi:hypothetical protein